MFFRFAKIAMFFLLMQKILSISRFYVILPIESSKNESLKTLEICLELILVVNFVLPTPARK